MQHNNRYNVRLIRVRIIFRGNSLNTEIAMAVFPANIIFSQSFDVRPYFVFKKQDYFLFRLKKKNNFVDPDR